MMTIYDLLSDNIAIIRRLHRNGVSANYLALMPIYEDYCRMVSNGDKKNYIKEVLAQKYGYSSRYIQMIVNLMRENAV